VPVQPAKCCAVDKLSIGSIMQEETIFSGGP